MREISLNIARENISSQIICAENVMGGLLKEELARYRGKGIFLLTDQNVFDLYKNEIKKYLQGIPFWAMPAGEANKTTKTLFALLQNISNAGLKRGSVLIALGGGVVGDIGGLAAALYMRGIDVIQVPTTLLAQVDSSVGGKTAIDFMNIKNLIGAFKQPEKVFVDSGFLKTLPPREIRCGLGEIVKHGALCPAIFHEIQSAENIYDVDFLARVIPENIAYKASVVQRDPTEKDLRRCLNLGHTTGHALELFDGTLSHGEYVLLGMIYEAELSKRFLSCDRSYLDELEHIAQAILNCNVSRFDVEQAAHFALFDKKNQAENKIVCTVPTYAGKYTILELGFSQYKRALAEIKEELC